MNKPFSLRVIVAGAAILSLLTVGVLTAQGLHSPLALAISPERSVVKAGGGVMIRIALTNTSGRSMPLTQTEPELDFDVVVLNSAGKSPPDTERGHAVRDKIRRSSFVIMHQVFGNLEPNEVLQPKDISVDDLYEMSHPGEYTIQVFREIPKGFGAGVVRSNIINVTVTE